MLAQTLLPDVVIVQIDHVGRGAAHTRNAALASVSTEWVAFLDDDDLWLPQHLQALMAVSAGADLVYSWFTVLNGYDPLTVDGRSPFGQPWSPALAAAIQSANFIPVTVLARTAALRAVGGFTPPPWASADNPCEDWGCWLKLLDAGAVFRHLPQRTWQWRTHAGQSAGRPWH